MPSKRARAAESVGFGVSWTFCCARRTALRSRELEGGEGGEECGRFVVTALLLSRADSEAGTNEDEWLGFTMLRRAEDRRSPARSRQVLTPVRSTEYIIYWSGDCD